MSGRPPKVPRETLEPLLIQLRGEGSTAKAIARGLGYSADHIFKLWKKWGIKKQLKPIKAIAHDHEEKVALQPEGASHTGNHPAASEAKPSDSPLPGSH